MNLRELLDHLRKHILRDTEKPSLWSDDELTLYLNEAYAQFARRTHCLVDDEVDFTQVRTRAGVPAYALDPRIVFIAGIATDTGRPLRAKSRNQVRYRVGEGEPVLYSTDAAYTKLKLYPTPDAEYVLPMVVARLPLEKLANDDDVPEFAEDYHLALCDWAAYRALNNNDTDAGKTIEAEPFRARWEVSVRDAKRDVFRTQHSGGTRAVSNWTGKVR